VPAGNARPPIGEGSTRRPVDARRRTSSSS
jgi:hypothetical protein